MLAHGYAVSHQTRAVNLSLVERLRFSDGKRLLHRRTSLLHFWPSQDYLGRLIDRPQHSETGFPASQAGF
jgi:hypothetical protein